MDFLSVKEIAQKWNISARTVNMYLNSGRVPGAIRKDHAWLIPKDAQKPEDRRRKINKVLEICEKKCFMPILMISYASVESKDALAQIGDDEEYAMAQAGQFYFQGESSRAMELTENYLCSPCTDIRLSALWLHAMSAVSCGKIDTCVNDFAQIKREGEMAQDDRIKAESMFISMTADIYFHRENIDANTLMSYIPLLPYGIRYFVMYGRAHALYLNKNYSRCIGEVEAALTLMSEPYPIATIYLSIVGAMASNSLALHNEAQKFFNIAWNTAYPEGYFEPFAEHHGLLQGLIERKIRSSQPALYSKISELVYKFSRGWMKIHNPESKTKVTDMLTPYEFSIAMLAAKGRTNKEISEYMSISVNSVKAYLATIYQKIGITKRSELIYYVNY